MLLTALPAHAMTVFTVGVEDIRYYPHYTTHHGIYTGFSRAVLDDFARERGYRFEYIPLPVLRLYRQFLHGDTLDFKYPDNAQWQQTLRRGDTVYYSDPLAMARDGVIVLPTRETMHLNQLKRLGTVRGFTATRYENEIRHGKVHLSMSDDFSDLMNMVREGRVDGGFGSLAVARYQLEHILKNPRALHFAPNLPYTVVGFRLSTRRHPEIIRELNDYLLRHADRLRLLRRQYGIDPPGRTRQ